MEMIQSTKEQNFTTQAPNRVLSSTTQAATEISGHANNKNKAQAKQQ
jgi:hypothetical protein